MNVFEAAKRAEWWSALESPRETLRKTWKNSEDFLSKCNQWKEVFDDEPSNLKET